MAHAYYIRAAIAAVRCNDTHAVTLLDLATEAFNSIDMFSFATAMRVDAVNSLVETRAERS